MDSASPFATASHYSVRPVCVALSRLSTLITRPSSARAHPGVRGSLLPLARGPPQHAAVAEATRDPVLVEPLEQELSIAATDAREVAEAGEGDLTRRPALDNDELARLLVGTRRDDEPVPEPDEPAVSLEIPHQLTIVDLHRREAGRLELPLQLLGGLSPRACGGMS